MTFAHKLVEIKVTRIGEVFPNWPLSFSAISGSFLTFRVPLAPRISSPIRLWPLRTDWSKSGTFESARCRTRAFFLRWRGHAKDTKRSGSNDRSDICGLESLPAGAGQIKKMFLSFVYTKRDEKRTRFSRGSSRKVRPRISAELGTNFSRGLVSKNANWKGRPFLVLFSTFCHGRASKNPAQFCFCTSIIAFTCIKDGYEGKGTLPIAYHYAIVDVWWLSEHPNLHGFAVIITKKKSARRRADVAVR